MNSHVLISAVRGRLALVLLVVLTVVCLLAGGASRSDVVGQVAVRFTAWIAVAAMVVTADWKGVRWRHPVPLFLLSATALSLIQLLPLPPAIAAWVPLRQMLLSSVGVEQSSWRAWSIAPGATVNAASSLIVPVATWILMAQLPASDRKLVPGVLLLVILTSAFAGLLQFSGATISNPLVNDNPENVGGLFANRNHFALFAATGCLIAAYLGGYHVSKNRWRLPAAWSAILLLFLTILASGSRAGLLVGVLALVVALVVSHRAMRRALGARARWAASIAIATIVGIIATFVLMSYLADRAVSIDRLLTADAGQDMRSRGLPAVLAIIDGFWPVGTGLGAFDPAFRANEPLGLLKPTYFNHAHNDFLEVVLNAGFLGAVLLTVGCAWWGVATLRTWRSGLADDNVLPRVGAAILLLVFVASMFDYPARTPVIMLMMIVSAMWLTDKSHPPGSPALPGRSDHL